MNSARWQVLQNIRMKKIRLRALFSCPDVNTIFTWQLIFFPYALRGLESVMQVQSHTVQVFFLMHHKKVVFCFLIKMLTGCLFFFIPFICSHKLTNGINNYCRWNGILLEQSLYKTFLLMESEGLFSSTLTPFSPVRYFTLARALSSASKYQTVIAYLVVYAGCTSWGFRRSDQKNSSLSNLGSMSANWALPSGKIRSIPPLTLASQSLLR